MRTAAAGLLLLIVVPSVALSLPAVERCYRAGIGLRFTAYDFVLPSVQFRPVPGLSIDAGGFTVRRATSDDTERWNRAQAGVAYVFPTTTKIHPRLGLRYQWHTGHQWHRGGLNPDGGDIYTHTKDSRTVRLCAEVGAEVQLSRLEIQFALLPACYLDRREDDVYARTDPWGAPLWGDVHERDRGLRMEMGAVSFALLFGLF